MTNEHRPPTWALVVTVGVLVAATIATVIFAGLTISEYLNR